MPEGSFEILLVDNGSDDGTPELLAAFAARDPAHRRVLREERPGSYAARNRGWREARGRWILFTDGDCRPEPSWMRALVQALDGGARRLCGGAVHAEEDQPGLVSRHAREAGILGQDGALARGFLQTANLAVERAELEAVGGFDESLFSGGDADLCWRLVRDRQLVLFLIPGAAVSHAHREDLGSLWVQFRRYGQSDVDLAARHGWGPGWKQGARIVLDLLRVVGAPVLMLFGFPRALFTRDLLPLVNPYLRALRVLARRRGQWLALRRPEARHRA